MSKMGELHANLHSSKVLLVCVFNAPPQPELVQKFSGSHASKAWDYFCWAERTFPCVSVEIRDGHNRLLHGRAPRC